MRYYLIACDVFLREVCYYVAKTSNTVDVRFLERGLHERPTHLRQVLQKEIDEISQGDVNYDAVLLAYALCGNSTLGLAARKAPLVIPKAHDCITLFLGSRERYTQEFNERPGTYYYTPSAIERGNALGSEVSESREKKFLDYVARFGEENARYLMEIEDGWLKRYSYAACILLEPFRFLGYDAAVRRIAREKSLEYREVEGDLRLIRELLEGNWDERDFLVVRPGQKVEATYDVGVLKAV